MELNILDLGLMDYKEALDIQLKILEKVQNETMADTLILVEHPPVITLGKNANNTNVLYSEESLNDQGISLYNISRGGDVTYHGPGQLVGYPIFNLKKNHGRSIKNFINKLEDIFIQYLRNYYHVDVNRHECNPGVWYKEEKILALGLAVSKGVTYHGFAFNLNTNLDHFDLIVPCGLSKMGVTSLSKITGQNIDLQKTKEFIGHYFKDIYNFDAIKYIPIETYK